eukprot:TRINITY_DN4770_c0_g1_i1.p1 TRINITY_DN4770_c0_g1~~TRINITY_DN4770_c0_g1_i1.p1  ORF type:complete len:310 (+),score=53.48 TRINITY_DN4770_c0_g1_i1:224-1153(+)
MAMSAGPLFAVRRGLTVSFEGNIGVGKSTILRLLQQRLQTDSSREVKLLLEPLQKWQNVEGSGLNLLQHFYEDPKRYGYLFQSFVFLTRFTQHRSAAVSHPDALRLSERCVFTDRCVFAAAAIEEGLFSPVEAAVYNAWYDPVVDALPSLIPDAFVYLRAEPEVCHSRLKRRARSEEAGVPLDYLRHLHQRHEQWFYGAEAVGDPEVDGTEQQQRHLPHEGIDNVDGLQRGRLNGVYAHPLLEGRPFLVANCNEHVENIDKEGPLISTERLLEPIVKFLAGIEGLGAHRPHGDGKESCNGSRGSGRTAS